MSSSDSLNGKPPSLSYKDLFHLNNQNTGLDSTARPLYSGNGEEAPVSLSTTKVEANCGNGVIYKPQVKAASWTFLEHSDVGGITYTISYAAGNYHKITLTDDLSNLVISDVPDSETESLAGEINLIIDAQGLYSVSGWPTTTYWTDGTAPDFGSLAANGLIWIKLITLDGGDSWLGQVVAYNMQPA